MKKWNKTTIQSESLNYKHKKDFTKNSKGAYMAAYRMGIIDEVCNHMIPLTTPHKYSKEELFKEGKKYSSRHQFSKKSLWAYKASLKYHILDEVCKHMPINKSVKWTTKRIIEVTNNLTLLSEFNSFKGLREASIRLGILDEVTNHLIRGKGGFNPLLSATFYFLKITHNNKILYKYGITNRSIQDRYSKNDLNRIDILYEYRFLNGQTAKDIEDKIKKNHKNLHYKGNDSILEGCKNTEILTTLVRLY